MKTLKPDRWYALFNTEDPKRPRILFSSRNKQEVKDFRRQTKDCGFIEAVDYNPQGLAMEMEFEPNTQAQVEALGLALREGGDGE